MQINFEKQLGLEQKKVDSRRCIWQAVVNFQLFTDFLISVRFLNACGSRPILIPSTVLVSLKILITA